MEKEMLLKMDLFEDLKFPVFSQQLAMARVSKSGAALRAEGTGELSESRLKCSADSKYGL